MGSGPLGGLQGQFWVFDGPGPFGSRNNAKKIFFEKKIWPILAQKDLEKFRACPPPQKIDQNRPEWAQ